MAGPGIPHERRDDMHLLDVAPTVLDVLGVPVPGTMRGASLVSGRGPQRAGARDARAHELVSRTDPGASPGSSSSRFRSRWWPSMLVLYEVEPGPSGPKFGKRNKPTYEAIGADPRQQPREPLPAGAHERGTRHRARRSSTRPTTCRSSSSRIVSPRFGPRSSARYRPSSPVKHCSRAETNRGLNESPIPIIEVSGFSGRRPANAVRLARGTVDALMTWLAAEQKKARDWSRRSILLQPLALPDRTVDQQKLHRAGLARVARRTARVRCARLDARSGLPTGRLDGRGPTAGP